VNRDPRLAQLLRIQFVLERSVAGIPPRLDATLIHLYFLEQPENAYNMNEMRLRFNEAKATQVASLLLRLRGGRMSYLKLIKLLYLLDREALLRWGRPVTTDRHVAMPKGPVVSRICDLIRDESAPGEVSVWRNHISAPIDYEVRLIDGVEASTDELSRAEEQLIGEIFQQYGHWSRWDLVKFCHDLPEWHDPDGSSIPIDYADILRAGDIPPDEIASIDAELRALNAVEAEFTIA